MPTASATRAAEHVTNLDVPDLEWKARVTEIGMVMHQLAVKLVEAVRELPDLEWAERYACVASIEEMAKLLRIDPVLAATFREVYGDAALEALVSTDQSDKP